RKRRRSIPFAFFPLRSMGRDSKARFALCVGEQVVSQNELGAGNGAERYADFAGLADQADVVVRAAEQTPAEALPARHGLRQLVLRLEAGEAVVILGANQRPVDARRADFERIGAGDRVGDIEKGRNGAADLGAVLDAHRRVIAALGHDLQRHAARADDRNAHQAIAHRVERGPDDFGDLVRIDRQPVLSYGNTNKKWAPGPTPRSDPPDFYPCRPMGLLPRIYSETRLCGKSAATLSALLSCASFDRTRRLGGRPRREQGRAPRGRPASRRSRRLRRSRP